MGKPLFRWVSALACMTALACAGAPRQRPIKMGPVDTGPGSLEYARQELEGTWDLQRAYVIEPTGSHVDVDAQARLQLDAYGNLSVQGEVRQPPTSGASVPVREMLQYAGRIVIDAHRQEFRLLDVDMKAAGGTATERRLDPQLVRRYNLKGDELTISLIGPEGRTTAVTIFKRAAK